MAVATVGSAQLAGILADPPFTDRWLRELADRGYLVKVGRAEWDLAGSVRGYLRFVRETEVAAVLKVATAKESLEAEKARRVKLMNDQDEHQLVLITDALAAIDRIAGEIRTSLAGIAPRITDDVQQRRRIDDLIDGILTDLADRLDQAGAALEAGRDPLAADAAHDA